jgi:isochorismate synthase
VSAAEPPFALCEPGGALIAHGVRRSYCDLDAAQAALRSGTAPIVLGALPFDANQPAALLTPDAVGRPEALPDWPAGPLPPVRVAAEVPAPTDYRRRISRAQERLTQPGSPLRKVVLSRALRLVADAPLDARVVLRRLVEADPAAYGYLVDLTAAGEEYAGAALVGASPELLVARTGDRVVCRPFAGSAPRAADPRVDAANAEALARSAKDRHEHRLVIESMRLALEPLCDDLTIAAEPQLRRTAAV